MSGIEEIPSGSRMKAYDYCNATWRLVATQQSGEVKIATGETIFAAKTVIPTGASGGTELGSGVVERVIITVPRQQCQGGAAHWGYSGEDFAGVFIGGTSGPYSPHNGGGSSGCITSGQGLWVPSGEQKEIYVQNLNEIYVCAEPSGWPVTYIGEVITC